VNYLAQSRSEDERAGLLQQFEETLATAEGQKPFEEDEERRRSVVGEVLAQVKDLGQGSERGMLYFNHEQAYDAESRQEIEGFFNLLFAHFLLLFPLDSTDTKEKLATLLQAITSHNSSPVRYRLYA
jgi:translation initiation factor 3 subunit M